MAGDFIIDAPTQQETAFVPTVPSIDAALKSDLLSDQARLDALLAVSLLGYIGVHQKHTNAWYAYKPGNSAVKGGMLTPSVVPQPTFNNEDCRLVLEKMGEMGEVTLVWDPNRRSWSCRWKDSAGELYRGTADRMELAICRCAARRYWTEMTRQDENDNSTGREGAVSG